jgi:type IV secretion system protein VirB10
MIATPASPPASRADDLALDSVRSAPEVGRPASAAEGLGLAIGIIGAAAIGGFTMLSLAHHKTPPVVKVAPPVAIVQPRAEPIAPIPIAAVTPPTKPVVPAPVASSTALPPLLVVDDGTAPPPSSPAARTSAAGSAPATPAKTDVFFSPDEQFAARTGDEAVPTSHARKLEHPDKIVAQGTVIPAVLETALDSDLPGYARALVSRDVRAFDGTTVLIPRGSRLIGQYKSALQAGQSRALIVWNRLLRPDGVSIQLGSPATDDLGQTGLAGKVNSHFMQRFGAAILLSVVEGLAGSIGGGSSNTVVLGSVGGGTGAAGVALQNDIKISPTVRVMQGTPIQVFAARDLDFTEDAQ